MHSEARIAPAISTGTIDGGDDGVRLMRRLVAINLVLVALQPISAGLFLSGYAYAVTVHAGVALALQLGALIQAVTATVLWRRGGIPRWVFAVSVSLFVVAFLEVASGYNKWYWLHVPIGVGMFGWLIRLTLRLQILSLATEA